MISMTVASMLAIFLAGVVFFIAWLISKQALADREKSSPFECGFDPLSSARVPFSLRFFLLAVIFLIFDVEVVLLFPAVSLLNLTMNSAMIIGIVFFLIILIWGLFHEWNEGSLDWMN
uniref:NADH-ubiquinone oxidoreductase chain 3 n=1 Tax=Chrysomallon squamiferum TaxID=216257 RepID=S6C1D1_CHRSQ|nr:NADH dehydrogenase subunit 3 [Chrysomallon squamiferum]